MVKTTSIDTITKEMGQLSALLKEAEKNEANLSGRLHESMKRLKDEYKLPSIEEAKEALANLTQECENLKLSISEKFGKLQEQYEW